MSKDSTRKFPFRNEAFMVAREASTRIATRLLTRLGAGDDRGRRVDWLRMINEYLRFPSPMSDSWENRVLQSTRAARASRPSRAEERDEFWIDVKTRADWSVSGVRQRLEALYRD